LVESESTWKIFQHPEDPVKVRKYLISIMLPESNNLYRIDKLGHDNYMTWAFKMKLLLAKEKVLNTIEKEAPNPVTDEWIEKSEKALQFIGLSCLDNQIIHIKNATTAKEAWNILKERHQLSTMTALTKTYKTELKRGGSMRDHLDTLFTCLDELNEVGEELKERTKIGMILSSLNSDYDNVVTAIQAWDDSRMTINLVQKKLIEEADKIHERMENYNRYRKLEVKQTTLCYQLHKGSCD
jgi:gag-polypeptide of LTR copia-type